MDFHILGVKKTWKKFGNFNEIGQILVSGALDDTKKMRKAGGDIFVKSGLNKLSKKKGKSKLSPGFYGIFQIVPWI